MRRWRSQPRSSRPSRARNHAAATLAIALLALPCDAGADGIGNENAPPQEICGTCHGLDGISRMPKFPKLAGQKADYLERQLRAFREGRRRNDGGQMAAVATEIREEQVAEVARYFASQLPPKPQALSLDAPAKARAEQLFIAGDPQAGVPACRTCHLSGVVGNGRIEAPHLTAQHEGYIAKQLRDFRSGARDGDPGGVMRRIAGALSETDIAALAGYLAALPRESAHE